MTNLEMSVKSDDELTEIINNPSKYTEDIIQAATLEQAERMVRDGGIVIEPQIELPKNTKFAGFLLRLSAYFIDYVLIFISAICLIWLVQKYQPSLLYNLSEDSLLLILNSLIVPLYFALLESSKYRGTIGKLVFKISVVDSNFKRISFIKALIRNISKFLSFAILLLGYISILRDKNKQGWHDMIAGCYMIVKHQK